MTMHRMSRRTFTAGGAGFAAGLFATSRLGIAAQDATPDGDIQPTGFVSTRVRTVESSEQRERVNELVVNDFAPNVEALEGFAGYVLGDVIDDPAQSLSILVMEQEGQTAAFNELASEFVATVEAEVSTVDTVQWAGDLLITGASTAEGGTPVATPVISILTSGYVAVRIHTSLPGTDPRDFVTLATSGFLPIVSVLQGFEGYLWYPIEGGFVAISLFDSEESAKASNDAAREWAAEFLTDYTDGNPEVINADVVYANLPILGAA
jgi:hypothetical protein